MGITDMSRTKLIRIRNVVDMQRSKIEYVGKTNFR